MTYTLRHYQDKCLSDIRAALIAGKRRIVAVAPTGAGKTLMFALGIAKPALAKGKVTWIVAPRRQLVLQTSRKLDEIGCNDHSIMMGGHWRFRADAPIQVCSVDTLRNRFGKVPEPDIIILDECHHFAMGNSWEKVVSHHEQAIVIGFTATPIRLDNMGLGDFFDHIVVATTIKELIEMGFLVEPIWAQGPMPDLVGVRSLGGDYNQKDLAEKVDRPKLVGDAIKEYLQKAPGKRCCCFAINVLHSQHLVEEARAAGITAEHLDASTPDSVRQHVIKQVEKGEVMFLSSVGLFTEGFDLPAIECVLLCRPTKSLSLYIQMAGRGLRPKKGIAEPGEHCVFLDCAGLAQQHGSILQHRAWRLEKTRKRTKKTSPLPKEVMLRVCPHCAAPLVGDPPPAICPDCGKPIDVRDLPPVAKDVALQIVDQEKMEALNRKLIEARQRHYRELESTAFMKGWSPMAVYGRFKKKWGCAPTETDKAMGKGLLEWRRAGGKASLMWVHNADKLFQDDMLRDRHDGIRS